MLLLALFSLFHGHWDGQSMHTYTFEVSFPFHVNPTLQTTICIKDVSRMYQGGDVHHRQADTSSPCTCLGLHREQAGWRRGQEKQPCLGSISEHHHPELSGEEKWSVPPYYEYSHIAIPHPSPEKQRWPKGGQLSSDDKKRVCEKIKQAGLPFQRPGSVHQGYCRQTLAWER